MRILRRIFCDRKSAGNLPFNFARELPRILGNFPPPLHFVFIDLSKYARLMRHSIKTHVCRINLINPRKIAGRPRTRYSSSSSYLFSDKYFFLSNRLAPWAVLTLTQKTVSLRLGDSLSPRSRPQQNSARLTRLVFWPWPTVLSPSSRMYRALQFSHRALHLWLRGCFSSQPTIPFEATLVTTESTRCPFSASPGSEPTHVRGVSF